MKRYFLVPLLFSMALLAGCTGFLGAQDTAATMAQAKLADMLIQSGVVDEAVMSVELSDAELDTYIDSLSAYNDFRDKWKDPTADMYLLLDSDYLQLYAAYKEVESIVLAHWDEYPLHVQTTLRSYRSYAAKINAGVSEALKAKNSQEAINNAITLGIMIAKIAAV